MNRRVCYYMCWCCNNRGGTCLINYRSTRLFACFNNDFDLFSFQFNFIYPAFGNKLDEILNFV